MQRVCRRPGCPCLPARRPRWWVAVAPGAPLTLACPLERKKREVTVSEGHSGPHARGHSLCRSQVPVTEARSVVKAGRGVTVTCVSFKGTFSVSAVRRVSGLVTRKVGGPAGRSRRRRVSVALGAGALRTGLHWGPGPGRPPVCVTLPRNPQQGWSGV